MIQFLKKRWVYHSLIWITSYLILTSIDFFEHDNTNSFWDCLRAYIPFFVPVFFVTNIGFWAKGNFFDSRQYILYLFAAAFAIAVGIVIYEVLEMLNIRYGMENSILNNVINYTFIHLATLGLQYSKRGIINQYRLQESEAKTAISELNALKAQINPHFLFNTLNNIYGMNRINPEKGSEMIMELSDVMRYHLEFSKVAKVKLQDEIQLLRSYVKLEKLRLTETCNVQTHFEDVDERLMISPLLLIPFVENAFKHGTHPSKECYVHLKIKTTSKALYFTVKNSVVNNRKVVKTNIGLQNTKRRLELLFPDKHNLNITKNELEYLVEMYIEL